MSEKHYSSRPQSLTGADRSSAWLQYTLLALFFCVAAVLVCAALKAGAQSAPAPKSSAAADPAAAHGKEVFIKNGCYQCHGYVGQGGTKAGVRIGPDPLPWQAIAAYIRKPAGEMPPYSSKLVPDDDVQAIYAYLKSVPPPVDIKRIPTFTK